MAQLSPEGAPPLQGRQRVRLFFCHLQKTGGSSIIRRFHRHFPAEQIYPSDADGDRFARVISVSHLLSRWAARKAEVHLVAGHFPLCTQELLGGEFGTFTILRDPVERTLSYLRHRQRLMLKDRYTPLHVLYDDPHQYHGLIHNHMVKMLSLSVDEMNRGALTHVEFDRARLERAKSRLAGVDVIGLQNQHEQFCRDIARTFDVDLGGMVRVNPTQQKPVSAEFRERIARDNALDIELYDFARELLRGRGVQEASAETVQGTASIPR